MAALVQVNRNERLSGRRFTASMAATVVPSAIAKMATLELNGASRIFVQITVAVEALTAFSIRAKPNSAVATALALFAASGDFTSPAGLLVDASGDLTGQGVGTGWFLLNTAGLDTVELWATSSLGTATLAIEAGGG